MKSLDAPHFDARLRREQPLRSVAGVQVGHGSLDDLREADHVAAPASMLVTPRTTTDRSSSSVFMRTLPRGPLRVIERLQGMARMADSEEWIDGMLATDRRAGLAKLDARREQCCTEHLN